MADSEKSIPLSQLGMKTVVRALAGNSRVLERGNKLGHEQLQALGLSTAAATSLGMLLKNAISTISPVIRTQIATGTKLNEAFVESGLSLSEDLALYGEQARSGLLSLNRTLMGGNSLASQEIKTSQTLLSNFKLLGGNTKALLSVMRSNTDMLGINLQSSNELGELLIDLGRQRNVDTNILVDAVAKLTSTLVRTSATYGSATSKFVQEATSMLTSIIPAATDQIGSVIKTLFGGTAESVITAQKLGIDPSRLQAGSAQEVLSIIMDAVGKAGALRSGTAGGGQGALQLAGLMEGFGFDENFLMLNDALLKQGMSVSELLNVAQANESKMVKSQDLKTTLDSVWKGMQKFWIDVLKPLTNFIPKNLALVTGIGAALSVVTGLLLTIKMFTMISALGLPGWVKILVGGFALIAGGFAARTVVDSQQREDLAAEQRTRDERRDEILKTSASRFSLNQDAQFRNTQILLNAIQASENSNLEALEKVTETSEGTTTAVYESLDSQEAVNLAKITTVPKGSS